ncbi:SusC/RagA family TonB-linked outer membrane protein [Pricia sp. S334]|uniref:SusC/RagA family TonB-linked outer membrane protein n=1 Tax=Pricia mediterranea TaxID=3076079 RepID=A0ABU3L2I0_9FLAO|nr:SusC/RagA family TonB-linked outer membrane protein [Pricia sp. S334]MDT7827945.1 SusC/RagA family TonB-linked outer membrane protein [Pricia sp. S334]
MKTRYKGVLTLLLALVVQVSFAQEKTISGTVTDQDGLPLPGVNIVVQGTTTGTQTDFDGNYSIQASEGQVLSFTYVGQQSQEMTVGSSSTIDVQLSEDAQALEEVVVVAQNIKREAGSLGYAVSDVGNEQIEERAQGDIGRILQGKAAGVNITATNGVSGSGTNFVIRGYSSISGSNQPLFIVDGVPFDGGANEQSDFFDSSGESSRFLDLDPNSIENVKVLKGLSATVLYGERGRNGVVLITTKSGSQKATAEKLEVTASTSYFISKPILQKSQKEYGGGFHQAFGFFFSNWGPAFSQQNPVSYGSYYRGLAPDGTVLVQHPFDRLSDESLKVGFEDLAASDYRYQNYNSIEDFFRTGGVSSSSVNLRGSTENATYNLNLGHLEDKGFTPGNKVIRNNISIGGSANLTNKLRVSGTLNYSNTDYKTPPIAASLGSGTIGDGASVFGDVLYTPISVDLMGLPFQTADGRSIYYRSGNDIQNPRWTVENSKTTQNTERIFGNMSLGFDITDHLGVSYQLGLDTYTEFNTYGQNKGGVDGDPTGIFRTTQVKNKIWNHTVNFNYDRDFSEDLNLQVVLGGQARNDTFERDGVESTQQLAFGVLKHFNFVNHSTVNSFTGGDLAFNSFENQLGVYTDITLGYKRGLYLNLAARNDWSSTLERDNYSIFYPAASLSFLPTQFIEGMVRDNFLSSLKVRAGYGTSAGFPDPYGTRNTLNLTSRGFVSVDGVLSSNSVSDRLGNPDLKAETVSETEIGVDAQFFRSRLSLNVSLYKKKTKDLITDQNLDPSTGFTVTRINAGSLETKGVEVDFDFTPVRTDNFSWNLAGNFFADESTITSLPEGTDQIAVTNFVIGSAANYAIVGEPFGVLQGSAVVRNDQGELVVGDDGLYLDSGEISILGDPNPDWNAGLTTTFRYKAFSLSANLLYRHGGDIFSQTIGSTLGRGTVGFGIDRTASYVLPGVRQDGTPNTTQITASNLGFDTIGFADFEEFLIYDGTTIRLNEVSLSYNMPSEFLKRTPFGQLSFTLSGNNIWYDAVNTPDDVRFDTNTLSTGVGNGQGIDYITGPSSRRYGLSVKATF